MTTGGANTAYIRLSNGDGTFRVGSNATGTDLRAVYVGDVNNDGKEDFVATAGSLNQFSVFLGNGNGTFNASQTFSGIYGSRGVVLTDLNGDGNLDLAAYGENTMWTSLGAGNGTFAAFQSFVGNTVTQEIIAGDLDSDGRMDLVATSSNGQTTAVYWGNGDGTFLARVNYTSSTRSSIAIGDFNNDGRLDMASGYSDNSSTSIYLNQGSRTFSATNFNGNFRPGDMHAVDQNGDGNLDLVGVGSLGAFVVLGNGGGTFKAYQTFAAGNYLVSTTLNDLNGDDVMDLVVVASNDDALQVLLANSDRSSYLPSFSLRTTSQSKDALDFLRRVSRNVSLSAGNTGASVSRLETILSTIQTRRENYLSAASTILDVDVATESAELTRKQILQSSAQAVLTQANQLPQLALRLLQGGF